MKNSLHNYTRKPAKFFISFGFAAILALTMPFAAVAVSEGIQILGLKKIAVPVVGTGSMYPSLFWETGEGGPEDPSDIALEEYRTTPLMYRFYGGFSFAGKTYFKREVSRGDMIAFRNEATKNILIEEGKNPESGFIKRVVALEGDTVEIRDGFLIINGKQIEEPYINLPRSTYGGEFTPNCSLATVPDNSVYVLGDNRKVSSDSRHDIGFVKISDINFILPLKEQGIYHAKWRDTTKDAALALEPTLNQTEFINLLNAERAKISSNAISQNNELSQSSTLRAKNIISTGDTSISATISGYSMQKAMAEAGYSNILTGEILSVGYYTAGELIQNLLHFKDTSSQVLDSKYQEIGVGVANGEINGCPTQVIVGHLGGYKPADYDQQTLTSWKELIENLNQIIPSWEEAREYDNIDQVKLAKLLDLLYSRRELAVEIYDTMQNRNWLTDNQQARIQADEFAAKEAIQITKELNQR